jgi:PiT family inorganic phosphate transporter
MLSPLLGFVVAGALLLLARALIHHIALYAAPRGEDPPPWPVRALLVATCTGVSFAHGSNDGQKGMGLIMLILIGITPVAYALNAATPAEVMQRIETSAAAIERALTPVDVPLPDAEAAHRTLTLYLRGRALPAEVLPALARSNAEIAARLHGMSRIDAVPAGERRALRIDLYLVNDVLAHLAKAGALPASIDAPMAERYRADLKRVTTFIPTWVKVAVALALGLGTTVGWKRIVVTVGEKIGRAHLSYAQGAAAELATFATIEAADVLGLPVSTTHVLSSGVAGTMVANRSGLQAATLRRLLLTWLLTLPVCVLLGATSFAAVLFVMFRLLGIR